MATETLRPDGDVAVGNWTTAPLFSKVNSQSDGASIRQTTAGTFEMSFPTPVAKPGTITKFTVRIRAKSEVDGALDLCTESNGTAFGDTKPNTPPFPHVPDSGFGGWIVDAGAANYKIQSNKAEQQAGHSGGAGAKYCADDVANDNFTYFADIVSALDGTQAGLVFRANENPEDGTPGNYWEQHGDGLWVYLTGNVITNGYGGLLLGKRVAGVAGAVAIASNVTVPFRMVLIVSGENLDVYSEPIGGGTRTAIVLGVDLVQSINGNTESFNDASHARFGLHSASNLDIGTTFDNITAITNGGLDVVNLYDTPAEDVLIAAFPDPVQLAADWAWYKQESSSWDPLLSGASGLKLVLTGSVFSAVAVDISQIEVVVTAPPVWAQDAEPAGSWTQDAEPAGSWVQD